MNNEKNKKSLNWDEFVSLGNPENAPELPDDEDDISQFEIAPSRQRIRIYLDRKKRKGKGVTIIEGIEASHDFIEDLTREFKKMCGVGGSFKDDLILIQGDQREKLKRVMIEKGFKDTKISGG